LRYNDFKHQFLRKEKKSLFRPGWKDYLSFSTRERKGAFALIFILILQIIFSLYLNFSEAGSHSDEGLHLSDSALAWMKFHTSISDENDFAVKENRITERRAKSIQYFKFDPNQCSESDFESLGLSKKQAAIILNYLKKGGAFKKKTDFRKMYCINESQYLKLEPWIALPDSSYYPKSDKGRFAERKMFRLDLAVADSLELIKLRGIGSVFAKRIVKYRERLGGFSSVEQLKEVWGMTDSLYLSISPHLFLSDSIPASIALNSILLSDLGKHPYVGFELGKVILNYREQHGPFKVAEDIKKVPLVTEEIFRKLAPYLSLEIK